mgnify:CR=1 FL=1
MNGPVLTKKLTRAQAATCWLIAFTLGFFGVFLLLGQLNWRTVVGLALILWGNNLSQVRHDQ